MAEDSEVSSVLFFEQTVERSAYEADQQGLRGFFFLMLAGWSRTLEWKLQSLLSAALGVQLLPVHACLRLRLYQFICLSFYLIWLHWLWAICYFKAENFRQMEQMHITLSVRVEWILRCCFVFSLLFSGLYAELDGCWPLLLNIVC